MIRSINFSRPLSFPAISYSAPVPSGSSSLVKPPSSVSERRPQRASSAADSSGVGVTGSHTKNERKETNNQSAPPPPHPQPQPHPHPHHPPPSASPATIMVDADELKIMPNYEQSVNPFLFHLEQGWRLKPLRHRYMKKKTLQQQQQFHQQQQQALQFGKSSPNVADELPVDPSKPHFADSNEVADGEQLNYNYS